MEFFFALKLPIMIWIESRSLKVEGNTSGKEGDGGDCASCAPNADNPTLDEWKYDF